jgi:hypothetical protein
VSTWRKLVILYFLQNEANGGGVYLYSAEDQQLIAADNLRSVQAIAFMELDVHL